VESPRSCPFLHVQGRLQALLGLSQGLSGEEALAASVGDKPAIDGAVLKREVGAGDDPAVGAETVQKKVHDGSGVGGCVVDLPNTRGRPEGANNLDVETVFLAQAKGDITGTVQVGKRFGGQLGTNQ